MNTLLLARWIGKFLVPFHPIQRQKNMSEQPVETRTKRTAAITFLAVVNGIAFVVTIFFWGVVYFKNIVPLPGELVGAAERANAATTYGFLVGDILWSAPLLCLATVGLWRQRFWGWTAAQMANTLWVYSMTIIWMRDAHTAASPGTYLFTPFALVAVWATYYLWHHRTLFGIAARSL